MRSSLTVMCCVVGLVASGTAAGGEDCWAEDVCAADTSGDADTAVDPYEVPADLGQPCEGNEFCVSGFCIQTPDGKQCTTTCVEECPLDWECMMHVPSLPDQVYICMARLLNLCRPCMENDDCLNNGTETGDYLSLSYAGHLNQAA